MFVAVGTLPLGAAELMLEAESARLGDGAQVREQAGFKGVAAQAGAKAVNDRKPDIEWDIKLPPGRYDIKSIAGSFDAEKTRLKSAPTKYDSSFALFQIGDGIPTSRVVLAPWQNLDKAAQDIGIFIIPKATTLKVWLPAGITLDSISIKPYKPPKVPQAAWNYQPKPLKAHPRLWMNPETLPEIKANLEHPRHKRLWEKVKESAAKPYPLPDEKALEIKFDTALENAAVNKAFVALMTDDEKLAREAIELMKAYVSKVEFGNLLDITRERGNSIYMASLVYDWCYPYMTYDDKKLFHDRLMESAINMEMGYPPYGQIVTNGHGNEAQLLRDMLAMGIALYDENPEPYTLCAYRIYEELIPLRRFEYASARHNQGVGYAIHRFQWEVMATMMLERATGEKAMDDNTKNIIEYFLYLRQGDKYWLRDGDGRNGAMNMGNYWILLNGYAENPVLRKNLVPEDLADSRFTNYSSLLQNNPNQPEGASWDTMPLTRFFPNPLGAMIIRNSWEDTTEQPQAIVEVKGGVTHFGNHQHSDAGSFQAYYKGELVGDVGQYHFYGTPYDYNFNKRSISHSLMLFDTETKEKRQYNYMSEDGGQRYNQRCPANLPDVKADKGHNFGWVMAFADGPDAMKPTWNYMASELTPAYLEGALKSYQRFAVVWRGKGGTQDDVFTLVFFDRVISNSADAVKKWQMNSIYPSKPTAKGWSVTNPGGGQATVEIVHPKFADCQRELLDEAQSLTVGGKQLTSPGPEIKAFRSFYIPPKGKRSDLVTVVHISDAGVTTPEAEYYDNGQFHFVKIGNRATAFAKEPGMIAPEGALANFAEETELLLTGIPAGKWLINDVEYTVNPDQATLYIDKVTGPVYYKKQ